MFRFRLGSIPVQVQASHLLVSGMLAWSALGNPTSSFWLFDRLVDRGHPGYVGAAVTYILSWMAIVFVSVLIHELGHAVAFRLFGYRPSIALVWLGGYTAPEDARGPLPWHRDVITTAAGPLFGLVLGVGSLVALAFVRGRWTAVDFFLGALGFANIFWTVLNLMPVLPLDGGRITSALATRVFGRRGFIAAQVLALLVCAGVVLWNVKRGGDILLVMMFAMFGMHAFRAVAAALRGQGTAEAPATGPQAQALAEAQEALRAGRLDDARRLGATVLESESLTPTQASRAHHLLGWVALKAGQGRAALDHFSQVQGHPPVETHAMAAALSLIGDETRAVAAWELAWRESSSRTVLHEYAGSLIRLGKVQEALRLPQVEPAAAFQCAERALFIRGAYSEAAAVGELALKYVPDPGIAYDAACAFARARDAEDAVRLLHQARELGFRDAAYAASDEDLASLHGHPAFEAWLTALRQSQAS